MSMKHTLTLLFVLACKNIAQAITDETVFLERGRRGIVPCPPIVSRKFTLEETDAVYWYHRQRDRGSLLISYFRGNVAPQNGIPKGVYDIDSEFSLVIENVTASDEGFYFFLVKPKTKMVEDGHVNVCDKVSPSRLFVQGCDQRSTDPNECDAHIGDSANLTCEVDFVKPAVELSWFRVFANGSQELVSASQTIRPVVLQPHEGSALRNHTFSTSSSIQLESVEDDVKYRCEAHGIAVGNRSHLLVRLAKAETQPPENTGTTPTTRSTNDESARDVCTDKLGDRLVVPIAMAVLLSVSLACNGFVILKMISRWRKHKDKKSASNTTAFKRV